MTPIIFLIVSISLALLYYGLMAILAELDPSEPDFKPQRKSYLEYFFRPSKERYHEE